MLDLLLCLGGKYAQRGIIGLGKMGGNLVLQCVEKGIRVVGKARGPKPHLTEKGVKVVEDYDKFVGSLKSLRVIYLSLPAGPTIDKVLKELGLTSKEEMSS